jgi:hypothetical protein
MGDYRAGGYVMISPRIKSDIAPGSARHAHELRLRLDVAAAIVLLTLSLEALEPDPLDYLLSGNYDAALATYHDQLVALQKLGVAIGDA